MEVYLSQSNWNSFYVGTEVIAHKNYVSGYKKILVSPIEVTKDFGNEVSILKMY